MHKTTAELIVFSVLVLASRPALAASDDIIPRSAEEREALLERGRVWVRTNIPSMDIVKGPQEGRSFTFGATVKCTFQEPDPTDPPGGKTSKFYCRDETGDNLKIKYGADNGEVPAEIAAS